MQLEHLEYSTVGIATAALSSQVGYFHLLAAVYSAARMGRVQENSALRLLFRGKAGGPGSAVLLG